MEKTIHQLTVNSADCLNNIKCDTGPQTGPFKCAVLQCNNKFVDFETHRQSPFKFHSFPTDLKHAERWKELCKLPVNAKTTDLKVCSDHFRFSDYIVNKKETLLNPDYKRSLRELALPLLNVGACASEGKKSVATVNTESCEEEDPEVKRLILEVTKLKNNVQELKRIKTWRKQTVYRKEKRIEEIKNTIANIDKTTDSSSDQILKRVFSEAQINLLKGSAKKIFWTDDDLAQAFTLRHMGGKDLYLYLKNTLNYPLPALSVINCPNSAQQKVSSTVFYFVPKDLVMATKWRNALKEHVAPEVNECLICSNHFEPDSFEADSSKLKNDAIPTLFTTYLHEHKDECVPSPIKKLKLANISSLLKTNTMDTKTSEIEPLNTVIIKEDIDVIEEEIKEHMDDFSGNQHVGNISEQIRDLQMLQQSLKDEVKMLEKQEQDADSELERLRKELKRKKTALKNLPNKEIEVLKKCFSKEQIRLLSGQISKARWTLDELAMAYTISSLTSRDFYTYLRNDLKYPLPALSNINRCYKSKYRTKDKQK